MKPGLLLVAAALALAPVAGLLHGSFNDGLASEGGIGLTNVSGRDGDCVTPTRQAACATLFDGSASLFPGGPAIERSLTVTWHGNGHAASAFGLYMNNFTSHNVRSQPGCAAADPAARLDLSVSQDGTLLYTGTLSEFARDHGSAPNALLAQGDRGRFSIAVSLDRAADNTYMGCLSTADLVWTASQ